MTYLLEHKADIIKYLPFFMQEYLEMQEITKTEDVEFNWLIETLMKMLDNQFITTCDEEGIARFEKVLDTLPYPNDSLEQRINRVLFLWNSKVPYTMRTLKSMLETLCGKDKYNVELIAKDYEILIETYFNDTNMINSLNEMLARVLPANLTVNNQNYINQELTSVAQCIEVLGFTGEYTLQQSIDDKALFTSIFSTIEVLATNKTYTIGGNK